MQQILLDIQFFVERNAYYYNIHRLEEPCLKKEDKVYLLRRNIKTNRLLDKLDYKKIRLFEIKEKIRKVNYRLKLPKYIQIYLVFYVVLLKLVPYDVLTIVLQLSKENELIKHKVEDIIDQSVRKGQTIFRVR